MGYNIHMNTIDYASATEGDICTRAIAFAKKYDRLNLELLLSGIREREDVLQIRQSMCTTFWEHDLVETCTEYFDRGYLSNWCWDNMSYMLKNSPKTLGYWTTASTTSLGSKVALVARALSEMPISDCLRVLRGEVDEPFSGYCSSKAQSMLHLALIKSAASWCDVSLHWVSTSELREAAVAMGWGTKYLPAMVHRNILVAGSEKWLSSVDYPYTLMACEMHRYVQQFGFMAPVSQEIIVCASTAPAVDIAMAQQIIAPHNKNIELRLPNSVTPLSAAMETRIAGFIQAHVVMDTLDDLALELSNGGSPRLHVEEALSLPDLDNVDRVESSFEF